MKKILILVIIVLVVVGGIFYYTKRLKSIIFANSFLKELEYQGTKSTILSKYLFSDFDITPSKGWIDFKKECENDSSSISIDDCFRIWTEVHLSQCIEYIKISLEYPDISIMTEEDFKRAYEDFLFFSFEISFDFFDILF